jgi:hypothetical protein
MRIRVNLEEATFAFPFGYTDPALAQIARESGVVCALTAEEELVDPADDPYSWGRFEITEADSAATIAACLSGWPDFVRRARQN